jgi:hypothetical protein
MKLKCSKSFAIEGAEQIDGSTDLKLLGSEYVANIGQDWLASVKLGEFKSEDHSFFVVYGENCKFFYIAQLYDPPNVEMYEVGLGYIYQKDKNFYLNRYRPLYFGQGENNIPSPVIGRARCFIASKPKLVTVSTYIPRSYIEILTDDNSIITSVAPHVPSSLVIEKDSLVGRIGENIENINIRSLNKVESFNLAVIDSIKDHTKQLVLKSSKLTTKSVNVDYLSLNITDTKPPAKDGNIYFDKFSGTIRYYYDNNWNVILSKEI